VRRMGDGERLRWLKACGGEGVADLDERREGWEWLWWGEVRPGALL
jgi:hypothetical protein